MVCEVTDRSKTQCLFEERDALRRGDPPRCIRHGALLFSDTRLDGMTRCMARALLNEDRW